MTHWMFVMAAYLVTLVGVSVLLIWSYRSMRSAEAAAEQLKRPR